MIAGSENRRLAYLDAMGVDVWVPRIALRGAKPAPLRRPARVADISSPQTAAVSPSVEAAPAPTTRGAGQAVDLLRELSTPAPKPSPPAAKKAADAARSAAINLVLEVHIAAGAGVLVSDSATSAKRDAVRLAANILRALPGGIDASAPRRNVIKWPPAASREASHDLAAAREFVGASVAAAVQQAQAPRLLVLGDAAAEMLVDNDAAQRLLDGIAVVRGPALQTMLVEPQTKASLWRAMQTLID